MAYAEFKDEFHGLRGGLKEAPNTCLRRYFYLLRRGRKRLREIFTEDERHEIGREVAEHLISLQPDRDLAALQRLGGAISETCLRKIQELAPLEQMALVDAIERTVSLRKNIRKFAEGPILIL